LRNIYAISHADEDIDPNDSLPDKSMFLISTLDPCYGDIILYLQTQHFHPDISHDESRRIRHHSKRYLIIGDTLYHHGIDTILRCCLTHDEAENVLNDCHLGSCGGHPSWMDTAQKILRASYFWSFILKYCIEVVKKCPPCQCFQQKECTHLDSLHPIFIVGPFSKWGIYFMHFNPTSAEGHGYIIVVVDYFTKLVEAMPKFLNDGHIVTLFLFNHIITHLGVPQAIFTDHGSHF
jgi:hypothetical protein